MPFYRLLLDDKPVALILWAPLKQAEFAAFLDKVGVEAYHLLALVQALYGGAWRYWAAKTVRKEEIDVMTDNLLHWEAYTAE